MLCEECHQHEATVHIQEIVGDKKLSLNLCSGCAAAKGMKGMTLQNLNLANLLVALAKKEQQAVAPPAAAEGEKEGDGQAALRCGACGLTFADFRAHGRLGCPSCYATFAAELAPLLRALHRGHRHLGRAPEAVAPADAPPTTAAPLAAEVRRLELALARAVAEENYEAAAACRDAMRQLRRREAVAEAEPPAPPRSTPPT